MPRVSNIYLNKKTGKFYFAASLGYDNTGKRVQVFKRGFPTQKEAKEAYDQYMSNYSESGIKKNSAMLFGIFYERYFEPSYKRTVRISTFENRKATMRKQFKYLANKKLRDISPAYLLRWQNLLAEKGYANGYIRLIFGTLEMVLDLAMNLGMIQKNPARLVKNVKKVKVPIEFWTVEQFRKVLTTFDDEDYYEFFSKVLLNFLFMTGLRFGEAEALTWKDIDFQHNLVHVTKSMYYRSRYNFTIGQTKTVASIRTLALDIDTINLLKKWQALQTKNIGTTDFVLSYNGDPTNKWTAGHIIERHAKLANVPRIKVHALRHSHASMLIAMGVNPLLVRDRLGHADIKTTLQTYGHLYPNTNREVADNLAGILDGVKENKAIQRKPFTGNQFIKKS